MNKNNTEDILKRILLNMNYDSKKTLSENKEKLTNIVIEQAQAPTPGASGIFNRTPEQPSKEYLAQQASIASKKLTPEQKEKKARICGHNSWEKYQAANWECPAGKLNNGVETSNFQDWYLTQKEKAKPDKNGLYTTKLCSKPCTKGQAVDGNFGENTKKLWDEFYFDYKSATYIPLLNVNSKVKLDFNTYVAQAERNQIFNEMPDDTKKDLVKVFRFTIENPSGWNYVSNLPDAIPDANYFFNKSYAEPSEVPYYLGWDQNNSIFPFPRKYTQEELKKLYDATHSDIYEKKLKEKEAADLALQDRFDLYDKTTVKSDRTGYDRYVADPSGIGQTKKEKDIESHEEYWKKELEPFKNKIYDGAVAWNKNFDEVKKALKKSCSTPIRVCAKVNINGTSRDTSNCTYISNSDLCKNAGGLWVYNVGTNNAFCGCRSTNSPGLTRSFAVTLQGRQGPIETTLNGINGILEWNTPETGGKAVKEREDFHHNMMVIELGLTAAGFASGPIGPLFFAAATIVGVIDGATYIAEGDTHMGVMVLALSVLGASEVAQGLKLAGAELKAIKAVEEWGVDGIKRLAKASVETPQLLTAADRAVVQALKESAYVGQKVLGKEMSKKVFENFTKNIVKIAKDQKWGWKELAKILYNFETHSLTFKGLLVYIGGVPYTIDQIYLALYGNDNDRKRSGIATLLDYLQNKPGEKEKALNEAWTIFQATLVTNDEQMKALEALLEKLKTSNSGQLDFSGIASDEEVLAAYRKENKMVSGFDEKKYNEILRSELEKEKEAREKEGCEKYNSLIKMGWVELTKINWAKLKREGYTDDILQKMDCGGTTKYLSNEKKRIEGIYPKTMSGEAPINKTMLDNTNM